tara:strand:- start:961 stop:1158 length:198 start_codon:yes stop_codon:yes gene_type:complete
LFDKGNLKYLTIWIISIALSLGFKLYGLKHLEQLSINYEIVLLMVFAPSLVVTMIIILKKLLKTN